MSARDRGTRTIAMFCHNYLPHPGGLEVMVQNLARGLAERHRVTLVTSDYEGTRGVSREDGMTVHRLPAFHWTEGKGVPYPVPLGPGVRAAMRAVRDADVVHAHGMLYAQTLMALRTARRAGAPLVVTEHVGFVEYRSAAVNAVERVAWGAIGDPVARRTAAVTTYNARVQRWLEARYGRPVRYIGNGVDVERFRPRPEAERAALRRGFGLPEGEPLVLFVGRATEKKNLDVVLRAPRTNYTLVLCGAAPGRAAGAERLVDLGIVPYGRMAELFACADAMVHASTGEGFPLATQEAIASGLPLVLLWDEGYAGWLPRETVAACDRLEEVAPAVAALAADPGRRAALAAAERDWAVRRWSWAATVNAYEDLYDELVDDRASGRARAPRPAVARA